MKDELNKVLKSAQVPEHSSGYWENFPKRVTARLKDRSPLATAPTGNLRWALGWAVAGIACGLLLAVFFLQKRPTVQTDYAKLYREISTMFPHQVRAIVTDETGVRVVLADGPDVPATAPLLVNVCAAQQCSHVITFSGQQIPVGTGSADVLTDGHGNIIVTGQRFVWSSAEPARASGIYHIGAGRLAAAL